MEEKRDEVRGASSSLSPSHLSFTLTLSLFTLPSGISELTLASSPPPKPPGDFAYSSKVYAVNAKIE